MRVFAPAKVNLGLSVLGVRDDGYHDLHTLFAPLSVGDELEVHAAEHLTLVVRGAQLPTGEGNLVYRAARAYLDAAGLWEGARIVLHKHLPIASGLGGGSSDAASTLLALSRLYPSGVDLRGLARSLGADVPFFLVGGSAVARGIGDRLRRVRVPRTHLVLANPGTPVSAGDAYRWLDATGRFTSALDVRAIVTALPSDREPPYFNTLQPAVEERHADIARTLEVLREAGLRGVLMSGSGATCFGLARDEADARRAAALVSEALPEAWVTVATTA